MAVPTQSLVREAVGVFQTERDLQAAIDDLLTHGFHRSELSLLASTHVIEEKLGHVYRSVTDLEDDPAIPTIAYASTEAIGDAQGAVLGSLIYVGALAGLIPVVASGGALAAAILAGAIGGSAAASIGVLLAHVIGQRHADYIDDQLRHGGLLLWVRTWNEGDEARAVRILGRHSGHDVHVHGLPDQIEPPHERFLGAVSKAEREAYRGETLVMAGDGACYAYGKVFPSIHEAKAYLDRRAYLATLHEGSKAQVFDLQAALADPARMFESPRHLMASHLPATIKADLLRRWAYDQKELEDATSEGMPDPGGDDRLQEIEKALMTLEGHPDA